MTSSPFLALWTLCICFFPPAFSSGQPSPGSPVNNDKTVLPSASLPEHALAQLGSAIFRQGSSVNTLASSPDGKLVASADQDGAVWLWDAKTGKALKRLVSRPGTIATLAFSPNSKFVASYSYPHPAASFHGEVHIWNVATGENTITLAPNGDGFLLAVAPDGQLAAVSTWTALEIVKPKKGPPPTPLSTSVEHPELVKNPKEANKIIALEFSSDGKQLTSVATDGTIHKWDPQAGQKLQPAAKGNPVMETTQAYPAWTFSAASKYMAMQAENFEIRVWDMTAGKELPKLPPSKSGVLVTAFSPNGKVLAGVSNRQGQEDKKEECIFIWDIETGKLRHQLAPKLPATHALCFIDEGKTLLTGHYDGIIRAWDVKTGKQKLFPSTGHQDTVTAIAYSPDSKYLLSASSDKTICKWEVKPARLLWTVSAATKVTSLAYASDGKSFATTGEDKTIRLWQASDGKALHKLEGFKQPVTDLAFSPNGKHLASWGKDFTLRLWEVSSGKKILEVKDDDPNPAGDSATVESRVGIKGLAFTPDGKHLFTGSPFGIVQMRNAATGKIIRSFYSGTNFPGIVFLPDDTQVLKVSPDGKTLALSNKLGTTWLWEIATGQVKAKLAGFPATPQFQPNQFGNPGFAFTGTGFQPAFNGGAGVGGFCGFGATGFGVGGGVGFGGIGGFGAGNFGGAGFGGGLGGFSAGSGFVGLGSGGFTGNFNPIPSMHPNDIMLQSASQLGHTGPVTALVFSPSGKYIFTGGQDHTILLWNSLTTKKLLLVGQHQGPVTCLACSPDGKTLASASTDSTILLWDMASLLKSAKNTISAEQLWEDLAAPLAPTAFKAMQDLATRPDLAIPLLKQKLKPAALPTKQIQKWLADLGSKDFATRAKATRELEKIAEDIAPALQQAADKADSLEVNLRLQTILKKLPKDTPSPSRLQQMRALEVLERLESPQALAILQTLAQGTPESWLTQEAKKAVERLKE